MAKKKEEKVEKKVAKAKVEKFGVEVKPKYTDEPEKPKFQ